MYRNDTRNRSEGTSAPLGGRLVSLGGRGPRGTLDVEHRQRDPEADQQDGAGDQYPGRSAACVVAEADRQEVPAKQHAGHASEPGLEPTPGIAGEVQPTSEDELSNGNDGQELRHV